MDTDTAVAVILNRLDTIDKTLADMRSEIRTELVSHREFQPVKKVVYGTVSLVLVGFITTLVAIATSGLG